MANKAENANTKPSITIQNVEKANAKPSITIKNSDYSR